VRPAVALAAAALLAGCGGSGTKYSGAAPAVAKRLLTARLTASHLRFHWVACVRTGRAYRGATVVRCNVDFGDPHVEGYCTVLRDGKLVTDHEQPAIPCRHDDAGPPATIVSS
jgi:hypothetical protein